MCSGINLIGKTLTALEKIQNLILRYEKYCLLRRHVIREFKH